ncbi:M48 family metalloprotease [Thalassomonas sp. M1454]|uniref:beta-barrel assembly-enhancing protease n=1 Tax=Thalassomonas sp. M1454 TaxID=2594477 RepID=UPI00117EBDF4|nr:M48 family metalloprotease [Thalassomonas sp. M1454]TRX56991.1 M48 family metallopeptidase [Thalassomonas sp. M1454]
MKLLTFKCKPTLIASALSGLLLATSVTAQQVDRNQLPEIGTSAVSTLSLDKEELYGKAMMRSLRASQPLLQDPVLIEYINNLGNTLVLNAEGVHYKFQFFVLKNQEINAFAFFGGHIGVHSGLITLADNESELASVLAHEVSHVTQRHLARKMEAQSRNAPLTMAGMVTGVLLTLVNPQAGFAALSTTMAASQQAGINYTRSNEKEADRVGMSVLVNSGFDPNGAPDFFRKMASKYRYSSKPPAMLLTHPLPDSRISDARNRAQMYPQRLLPVKLDFELAKARISARYEGNVSDNIINIKTKIANGDYRLRAAAEYGLAVAYLDSKDYDNAQKTMQPLISSAPQNLFYVDAMTDIYLGQKQYDKALTMLKNLNLIMPNNQVVTLNYANAAYMAGEYVLAETLLQDFIILNKENYIANDLLTQVYSKQKKLAQMHESKAEVLALLGAYPNAIDQLHMAYNEAEKNSLMQKRIKARILQFQELEEQLKRL